MIWQLFFPTGPGRFPVINEIKSLFKLCLSNIKICLLIGNIQVWQRWKNKNKERKPGGGQRVSLYTIVVILCLKFLTSGDVNLYVNAWESYPALATLIDCCSIASWMLMRSCSLMLLNSSMQHKPPSAKTRAPASRCQSPPSFTAATVSPLETHSLYEVIHWYYM